MLKKYILLMTLAMITFMANAHNPNSTFVVFSPNNGIWTAHFMIAQEGANISLAEFYKGQNLSELPLDQYKKKYIDYIKSKFRLEIDGKNIPLSSGGIKLGNHQTDIRFLLNEFPQNYEKVYLKMPLFEENEYQNTIVRFLEGSKKFRKVLKPGNNFEMDFVHQNNQYLGAHEEEVNLKYPIFIGGFILLLGLAAWFLKTH